MRIDDPRADLFPASLRAALLQVDADGMPAGFNGPDVEKVLVAFHRAHPGYDLVREVRSWALDHAADPPRDRGAALAAWLEHGLREGKLQRSHDRKCVVARCIERGYGSSGKCIRHITPADTPGESAPTVAAAASRVAREWLEEQDGSGRELVESAA